MTFAWRRPFVILVALALLVGALAGSPIASSRIVGVRAAGDEVRIAGSEPASFDPARSGDVSEAAILGNLYEGLTALDPNLAVRPALARSWEADAEWRRVVFRLREGLTFSDGTPLTSDDVVRSWFRLLDPARPSPLASLLDDVEGAREYVSGRSRDAAAVGLLALPGAVQVDFRRPAPWFIAATASPSLAVVPPGIDPDGSTLAPGSFVGSGAYVLAGVDATSLSLTANDRHWAGAPAISRVTVVTDWGDRGTLAAFREETLDYAEIPEFEGRWIRYDPTLGPALRTEPPLTVEYYGFDTTRPPFDDARVRQALGVAVDWSALAPAAGADLEPATSLVPPGIPGRSAADFVPRHDPAEARRLLAEAGYPGGGGFPDVALQTGGSAFDAAITETLHHELGVTVRREIVDDLQSRLLSDDPPAFWSLGWIADYPDPYDFLGILLGSGQVTNFGHWTSADFDAALDRAAEAATAADRSRAYEDAERIVQAEVPVVPVAYPTSWALARDGLLGATSGGTGIVRFAGLAWSGE